MVRVVRSLDMRYGYESLLNGFSTGTIIPLRILFINIFQLYSRLMYGRNGTQILQ